MSCASENQLLMGTACCGWKMYEVGELSMMMVSLRSRPICERSCRVLARYMQVAVGTSCPDLYVVALMVVATFAEKPVVNNAVDVELVEERVTVLQLLARYLQQ